MALLESKRGLMGEQEQIYQKQLPEVAPAVNLYALSKHELEQLQKDCSKIKQLKYPRTKGKPLYGNLPRVLTDDQLVALFTELRRFKNRDVPTAFLRMFFYGLRVGEVNSCRIVPGRLVQICTHKDNDTYDYLPLIDGTEELFRTLNKGKGYSPNYLANYFREACDRLGDDYTFRYGKTRAGSLRRQYSTHCLRKTAGNKLRSKTGDPYKEAVYLRHETRAIFGVTSHYMHYDIEEMRQDMNETFKLILHRLLKLMN